MTAGHFGLATGVKAGTPRLLLWALLLSTYWLDVLFVVLYATGIESLTQRDPAHPAYGDGIIHAYYTHSLVGALLIAAVTGWVASLWWGRQNGVVRRSPHPDAITG